MDTRIGFALALAALLVAGCAKQGGLRPDENVPSVVLRDAYFSKTRPAGGAYESERHIGTPTRHVDPAQDSHVSFIVVLNLPNNERTVAGELIRPDGSTRQQLDRKSTRLNSSHVSISYAVFCLKKKTTYTKRSTTRSAAN